MFGQPYIFYTLLISLTSVFSLPNPSPSSASHSAPSTLASFYSKGLADLVKSYPPTPITDLSVPIPPGQTELSVPAGQSISAVTCGRGIQNYTCTAGTWVTAGALANLYDVSGIFEATKSFLNSTILNELVANIAFTSLSFPDKSGLPVFYHHEFVTTPGSTTAGAISPAFFSADDQVIASKTGSLNSPDNAKLDVPWLELTAIPDQGNLATTVFRLDTVNGQPPASCSTEGASLSVQYAAMYYFLTEVLLS